jgi:hypothetical protein
MNKWMLRLWAVIWGTPVLLSGAGGDGSTPSTPDYAISATASGLLSGNSVGRRRRRVDALLDRVGAEGRDLAVMFAQIFVQ